MPDGECKRLKIEQLERVTGQREYNKVEAGRCSVASRMMSGSQKGDRFQQRHISHAHSANTEL